jgi:hypothetical protein
MKHAHNCHELLPCELTCEQQLVMNCDIVHILLWQPVLEVGDVVWCGRM